MHAGGVALFRSHGLRRIAQGRHGDRARGRPRRRRPAGDRRDEGGRAGPRAGEPEARPGRRDPGGHRPHRRRAHARARFQRGARAVEAGRHRLPPVAAAAAPRNRRCRVDDPRGRPDRGRLGLPSRRRLGRRRRCRAGLVLRRQGRDRARPVGARAGADGPQAAHAGRPAGARARIRAFLQAGRPVRDAGADDPPHRLTHRGSASHDHVARRHRRRPGPARHRQPAFVQGAGIRRQLGGQPDGEPRRAVRRHRPLRGRAGEGRPAGGRIARRHPRGGVRWREC